MLFYSFKKQNMVGLEGKLYIESLKSEKKQKEIKETVKKAQSDVETSYEAVLGKLDAPKIASLLESKFTKKIGDKTIRKENAEINKQDY